MSAHGLHPVTGRVPKDSCLPVALAAVTGCPLDEVLATGRLSPSSAEWQRHDMPLASSSGPTKGQGYRHEGSGIRYRTTLATSAGALPQRSGGTEPGRVVDSAPVLAFASTQSGMALRLVELVRSPKTTCCPTWGRVGLLPVQHAHSGSHRGHGRGPRTPDGDRAQAERGNSGVYVRAPPQGAQQFAA